MTEPDPQPVRPPDIWADPPSTATGRPLDLSQDPDRVQPAPSTATGRPLDLAQDPDRVQPAPAAPVRPLDPAQHPDRFDQTLLEMLGDGAQEEQRDTYTWLVGLGGMLAFLALVAFVASRLGP